MPPAEALLQAPCAAWRDDLSAAAVDSGAVRAYAGRRFTPDVAPLELIDRLAHDKGR
jgi:hypothetical protein